LAEQWPGRPDFSPPWATDEAGLDDSGRIRLVSLHDAAAVARLLDENDEFLAPWNPLRSERFSTEEGQRDSIALSLEEHAAGREAPYVILDQGRVVGRITLSGIVRGAFESANLGYWLAERVGGRGIASAAVAAVLRVAYDELGLHRVQAATLVHNERSQRVLARNGFERIGHAPAYLKIAGRWQDHLLFQRIRPE
jgi:ribosomal-protein-alanine N-acetyltransferase